MALSPAGLIRGLTARALANAARYIDSQSADNAIRLGPYGDVKVESVWNTRHLLADEGAYMVATTLPGATALQLGISANFSATAAAFAFLNSASRSDVPAKRCYPDYLRFLVGTAPASGANLLLATVLDDAVRTPTTISNAVGSPTGPGTPATATCYRSPASCANMDLTPTIVGVPYFPLSTSGGAPPAVPAAGPNARTIVGTTILRGQIPVVNDDYTIQFGNIDAQGALVTAAPAGACRIAAFHPPVVIGPGQWMLIYLWSGSNAVTGMALSSVEFGWSER